MWKAATPLKVVGCGPDVRCWIGKGVKSGIYFWWRLAVSQDFVRRRKGCPAGWLISSTVSQEFSHLPKPLITVTTTKVYYFWSSDTFGLQKMTTFNIKWFPFHSIFSSTIVLPIFNSIDPTEFGNSSFTILSYTQFLLIWCLRSPMVPIRTFCWAPVLRKFNFCVQNFTPSNLTSRL